MSEVSEKELERRRNYYAKNKQKVLDYQRKKRENMTEEEKEKKRALAREYYRKHKSENVQERTPQSLKKFLKPFKDKYKGFSFSFDGDVVTVEVKMPFRVMIEEYGLKHCDEDELRKLQTELRRRLYPMLKSKHIIIVDCQYTQLYLEKDENLDEVCEETRKFLNEKLEIYGPYYKNKKKCNKDFE